MGKKAENLCEFLFTVNISLGRKRVSSLANSLVTMTNLLPNLLPIATNTLILGETKPKAQRARHAPNPEKKCVGVSRGGAIAASGMPATDTS
jgi:hypothetical protein